ncbi:PEP-CTERM sorting domain-containing protein [Pontiella sp.]|uniref:PEP-CTERM sorting domain-containing protein n=1 Tax=Pontiella sp. TaxID=2837462 RepID=UPI0035697869
MNKTIGILLGLGLACAANAAIILTNDTVGTGTYFEIGDFRVNNDLIRVGGNDALTTEFIGLLAFDVSGSVAELQAATSITLSFNLAASDNNPALNDIAIDYVGTFANNYLGVNGVGGADANATLIGNSASIYSIFSGAETTGAKSYDATAIGADSFENKYAYFLVTDPSYAAHQWDIGGSTDVAAATLTVIPEPATLGLVAAFGGAVLFIRRRFMI